MLRSAASGRQQKGESMDQIGLVAVALRLLCLISLLLLPSAAHAAEPALDVSAGGETRSFTRDELLVRDDAATIEVTKDATYGGKMSYRAVPVSSLLAGLAFPPGSVSEVVAVDGFAAQIPLQLLLNKDASKAVAWLAIEPADKSWPKVGKKDYTAGPFYV